MSAEKATQTPVKAKLALDPRYVLRIAGVLLGICLATALLLGIVNQVTAPRIEAMEAEKIRNAMSQVLAAEEYVPIELDEAPKGVQSISEARTGGGSNGYVIQVASNGSQGGIEMMVGVGTDGLITGVSIVKHSETPNIGTKVVGDQSILDRFIGKSVDDGEITVNAGTNRFDGVSGATASAKGVAAGVNAALEAVRRLTVSDGFTPDAGERSGSE